MPTIMCTRKLWRAIGGCGVLPPRGGGEAEPSKLRTFSACELAMPWGHLVVALEETTYLTVVCPLLRLPLFQRAFAASMATQLECLEVGRRAIDVEVRAFLERTRFAKNDNRSLLGSVNDVAYHASVLLQNERRIDLGMVQNVQTELNQMPHAHREPPFPDQATRLLFSEARSA